MKDRTFLVLWGLSLVLIGSLLFTLIVHYKVSVQNNVLLHAIVQYHHMDKTP